MCCQRCEQARRPSFCDLLTRGSTSKQNIFGYVSVRKKLPYYRSLYTVHITHNAIDVEMSLDASEYQWYTGLIETRLSHSGPCWDCRLHVLCIAVYPNFVWDLRLSLQAKSGSDSMIIWISDLEKNQPWKVGSWLRYSALPELPYLTSNTYSHSMYFVIKCCYWCQIMMYYWLVIYSCVVWL